MTKEIKRSPFHKQTTLFYLSKFPDNEQSALLIVDI